MSSLPAEKPEAAATADALSPPSNSTSNIPESDPAPTNSEAPAEETVVTETTTTTVAQPSEHPTEEASTSASASATAVASHQPQPQLEPFIPQSPSSDSATFETPPPSRPPSNPLKRQISDNMESLIAEARASKRANTGKDLSEVSLFDKLKTELTCSICCEVFKDPVTVLDCLHNFCGSCIVPWVENNSSCPSCRGKLKGCKDAFALKPLLEMLFKEKPDLKISDEELGDFRKIYKPGQKIKVHDGYESMDDAEDDDDFNSLDQTWDPCPCCRTGEQASPIYSCPNPIQEGDRTDTYEIEFKQHKKCSFCDLEVPYNRSQPALKKAYCVSCYRASCRYIYGRPCPEERDGSPFLMKLEDASLYGWHNDRPYRIFFNNNAVEKDRLTQFVEDDTNQVTWNSLGQEMRDWLFANNSNMIPWGGQNTTPLQKESYICKDCAPPIFDRYLTDFMISERERIGWTDSRQKCWYGKDCRTQSHNQAHCARLQHVCNPVPEDQRGIPVRRPPQTSHTGPVRGASRASPSGSPPAASVSLEATGADGEVTDEAPGSH